MTQTTAEFLMRGSRYEDIFMVECDQMDDAAKVRLLLRKLNTAAHQKYVNFILPKKPSDFTFTETIKSLKDMLNRQRSLFSIRYQCLKLSQRESDDFITYASVVNRECDKFQLNALTEDQFICLVFVSGLHSPEDSEIRLRLLNKMETDPNVTIQALTEECRRIASLKQDAILVEGAAQTADEQFINAVTKKTLKPRKNWSNRKGTSANRSAHNPSLPAKPKTPCWLCGTMDFVRNCSFRSHKCQQCGITGHKEGYCQNVAKERRQKWHRAQSNRWTQKTGRINSGIDDNLATHRRFATITVDNRKIDFRIDTGSDLTLLTESTWKRLGRPLLSGSDTRAKDVSGNSVELLGQLFCCFSFRKRKVTAKCYASRRISLNLLWVELIDRLGMYDIPINGIDSGTCVPRPERSSRADCVCTSIPLSYSLKAQKLTEHPAMSTNGLGLCSKIKASLRLKPDASPVFRPKRPVPYAAVPKVDAELNRLEKLGVISKVSHSNWAAPIVVVKKANGSFRVCADFSTGLNNMLELHQYPLPTPEELFTVLNGGRLFSKLDFADAYLQVEVEDNSKELLTINTHRGLYRYNRLPFGVKSAPGIFQQIMDTMIAGLNGTVAYLDDVLVVGRTLEEHNRNLKAVLNRVMEFGFRIRPEKCQIGVKEIRYLGYIVNEHGRRPDPDKIAAIQRMPPPFDSSECQAAFEKAKLILKSDLLLTHFDPSIPVVVAADASSNGLGAVILHRFPDGKEKPIAHASRSLLPAEKNYSQIEEALALVFAVKKFHRMVHGRRFTLVTDHKPLLAIFGCKKGIPVHTANRLQRWTTTLLGYDFVLQYRSTSNFGHVDILSRLIARQTRQEEDVVIASVEGDIQRVLADAVQKLPVTCRTIYQEKAKDPLLKKVIKYLQQGWPKHKTPRLEQFYNRRESLAMIDGCLLFADRVVVPDTLQQRVLRQLHSGHPGIVRMKALAWYTGLV
uniref:RNA-directed DNA polymerase n=1 Tax=Trichuris muris TaxID=70415 RepID=A0A5S6QAU4_TRIMR